jgi:hypothetical protein
MRIARIIGAVVVVTGLAGCEGPYGDLTRDHGIDSKDLRDLKAGIWVDPNGCDHWIVDDGLEGYLSARLDPYGRPVCTGDLPGGYKTDLPK